MSIIIEILAALAAAFATGFAVYGIMSTIVKHKAEKEIEEYMKRKRDFYDDDYYDDDDY